MSNWERVAWCEGMFLRPQHFQQQERYLLNESSNFASQLTAFPWGVVDLELDHSLLAQTTIALKNAQVVMPDSRVVMAPQRDQLPEPLIIDKSVKNKVVVLAVPVEKANNTTISTADNKQITRYRYKDQTVVDNSGELGEEVLQLASLVVELKLDNDRLTGYYTLPIARIIEVTNEGNIILDEHFIPPTLNAQRNANIHGLLSDLVGKIKLRADTLAGRLNQSQGNATSIADFLMLQTLNRYEPTLKHLAAIEGTHPEAVCRLLYGMAGELSTYSNSRKRPAELPTYAHSGLSDVFAQLKQHLQLCLSTVLEQTAVQIQIEMTKFGIHIAQVPDKKLLSSSQFVLAVKSDLEPEDLRKRFPSQVKIGPVEHIRDLVNNQLPGIAVDVLPVAPRQIPYHAGYHYFQLDKSNEYWARLMASGGIAIHLSGHYPSLNLQCWAVNQ
ncbi:type VI secretion protein [Photobacterium jeanii]|uniref:Type VI secretion protein n=1 Tax=Photobacterium jeanii TaxID=858640 RepID=A0A178K284_9GAMM|nr:type VI secretion system baseplate subunit TssK [Photobacterium jeanii]OAN11055.1 type VI secretion protein [Photobacterium jeanii]PST90569.1 type VI secretion system baseplate subunit TssK [Photobacterium jeanii]